MLNDTVCFADAVKYRGLRFTVEPQNDFWQLRPPYSADFYTGLLGWMTDNNRIDAHVPPSVITLLSQVLCSCGQLTFFYPSVASEERAEDWQAIDKGACRILRGQKPSWLTRKPDYPLFSTSNPESAEKLFCAEPFSWELQQQMVLLSSKDALQPTLDYESVHKAYAFGNYELLLKAGIEGIFYPAVDGDFAGLMVFRKKLWEHLLLQLAESCAASDYDWSLMSEFDFQKIFKKSLDVFIFAARRNGGRKGLAL